MAFPTSPSNNQIALVNGIEYVYNTSKGAWYRYGDATANVITSNTFQVLSSITFADGTSQTTAGVAVDSYARSTANTASNNITILQGVDTTQNTNITSADTKAQAAFDSANVIVGVNTTQNTNITAVNTYAASAYGSANTNATNIGYVNTYAASGYAAANTNATNITAVNTYAASAYAASNTNSTNITVMQGVNTTQNTSITTADIKAQAAFDKANTAITTSGGSITGSLSISQNLTVSGNLTVLGNSTTLTTSTLDVGDSLIYLANNNLTSDSVDIGIIGHYNDGANAHAGIIRDPSLKEWIFFKGYTPEVQSNNLINIADPSFAYANVYASYFKGNLITNGVDIYTYNQGVNTTQNTNITTADTKAQAAFNKANSGIKTTTSATQPTGNNAGDLWYSTSDDTVYQYTYDGTSNTWVDISGPILRTSNIVVQYTITANAS